MIGFVTVSFDFPPQQEMSCIRAKSRSYFGGKFQGHRRKTPPGCMSLIGWVSEECQLVKEGWRGAVRTGFCLLKGIKDEILFPLYESGKGTFGVWHFPRAKWAIFNIPVSVHWFSQHSTGRRSSVASLSWVFRKHVKPKSVKTLAWVGGGQQLSEDRGNVWLVSWPSNPRSVAGSIVLWVWHTFNNIGRSMDCWTGRGRGRGNYRLTRFH